MAVNDTRVQQIIDKALVSHYRDGRLVCESVRGAWAALKKERDEVTAGVPNSLDLDQAAAENYLFARACVCEGFVNSSQMQVLAFLYYGSKVLRVDGRTSRNPQSPADFAVMTWGRRGAQDGVADWKRWNPEVSPPFWRPVEEIMGDKTFFGKGYAAVLSRMGTGQGSPEQR